MCRCLHPAEAAGLSSEDAAAAANAQRDRRELEETRFIMRLSMKAPLLFELPAELIDRFRGCEPAVDEGAHGECLVLCAQLLGIAISLPLDARFDRDQLLVRFQEITAQAEFNDVEETIDNLARADHARTILVRARQELLGSVTCQDLWAKRALAFPHLTFGLDVEDQLRRLNPDFMGPVVKRLTELSEAAGEWPGTQTPTPKWRSLITPESTSVMNNEELRNHRVFRDSQGRPTLFEWHARFGSSHSIHLRYDRATFEVEIGYIGRHLPLP
jgi:hypothetical protein